MMDLSVSGLLAEARLTLRDPRAGARRIMALGLPASAGRPALGLMAITSAILAHLSLAAVDPAAGDPFGDLMSSPIRTAVLQFVILMAAVWLIHAVGRARGGSGSLAQALSLMVWLQLLMLGIQIVQLVLQLALPPVAGLVNIVGMVLFFWLLTNFIAELHGFRSRLAVFGGVVVGLIGLGFVAATLLMLTAGAPVEAL
jgi:Yip1 domain